MVDATSRSGRGRAVWLGAVAAAALGLLGAGGGLWWLGQKGKHRLAKLVSAEADRNLDADVSVGAIEVDLLSAFPRISVTLRDVRVDNRAPFQGVTLFRADAVGVALDPLSLLSDEVEVRRIRLARAEIDLRTDRKGRSNTAITGGATKSTEDQAAAAYAIDLDRIEVSDLSVAWDDRQARRSARVEDLDLRATGRATDQGVQFDTTASIAALTVSTGRVDWLDRARVEAALDVDYARFSGGVKFGETTTVTVNALPVAFSGTVVPGDDRTTVDVAWSVEEATFASLLSLVPSAYGDAFAGLDAAGDVAFGGSAKGDYVDAAHLPALSLALRVQNGRFAYPSLPTKVTGVDVDLAVTHPGGDPDALVLDLRSFALAAAGAPFSGRLRVAHPTTDPEVDLAASGTLDLAALRAALPAATEGSPARGRVDLDLAASGRMSAFSAMDPALVKARGTARATGVPYVAEGWPELLVERATVTLDGPDARLDDVLVTWPDSRLALEGTLGGLAPWLATDDGVLTGRLAVTSPGLDARPFLASAPADAPAPAGHEKGKRKAKAAEPAPASQEAAIATVPTNLDLAIDGAVGRMVTPWLDLADVAGTITVKGGVAELRPVAATALGGRVTLEGLYGAPTPEGADVDVRVAGVDLDLAETFRTFATLRRIAPLFDGAKGRYGTGFSMRTRLGPDGSPELATARSAGDVTLRDSRVKPAGFAAVGGKLGGADTLRFAGSTLAYSLRGGRARIAPVTIGLGDLPATLSGSAGVVDGSLDFLLRVPVPAKLLAGLAPEATGPAEVEVRVGGTCADPKVTVDLAGAAGDAVREAAGKLADDALAGARAEADRLLGEAERAADRLVAEAEAAGAALRQEAKRRADQLAKEAKGDPAKALAAKEAGRQLVLQADRAADKLVAEARKQSAKLVGAARDQGDALLDAAEAKAGG